MDKANRLNQELIFLSTKNIFHINDLTNEFKISKRTALRDINNLEQMGLSFYTENGRYGGYHLISKELLIPITFNLEEINAIFFALNALTSLSATPFEKPYRHIYDKLMATLPKPQQKAVTKLQESVHYYKIPPISTPQFLDLLLNSILKESVLDVTYQAQKQTIQVFDLLYRRGIWFCNIYNFSNKKWTTYRCDNITHCQFNSTQEALTHDQMQRIQNNYEKNYHDIKFECPLTKLGVELFHKNNYPNMQLKKVNKTYYLYGGYNQEEFDYMVQYLITLGNNVKINYPQELKDAYLAELKQIISQY